MTQAAGGNARLIVGDEATYGTQPSSMEAWILPFVSETLQSKRGGIRSNVITGARNLKAARMANTDVSGTIQTELTPSMGTMLKHLLGTLVTSETLTGSAWLHTFTVGALPAGMCVEKGFTDTGQYLLFNGVRISKGSFECVPGQIVGCSFDLIGSKETVAASGGTVQSSAADRGHNPFDAFEATIKEGGSTLGNVKSIKFDVDNDLDASIYVIGSGNTRAALPEGLSIVTGTMVCQFDSMDQYTKAMSGTETSVELIMMHGTGSGTAGNEYMSILIPELRFERRAPTVQGPRGVDIELPFQAYYENSTEQSGIQISLFCSVESF